MKWMWVAGEASGDHHAAAMIRELRRLRPQIRNFGLGGLEMQKAGMELKLDLASKGVIGFVEVLKHALFFRSAMRLAERLLEEERPELLILVDYPGFNLRLAERAKRLGVKICYYISPQVWAWKRGRVRLMARLLDKMLVTFPFEKPIYDEAGLPCDFVGNPLLDLVQAKPSPKRWRAKQALRGGERLVGLLPGSREQEVRWLLPVMLQASKRLLERDPKLRFLVVKAPQLPMAIYEEAMASAPKATRLFEASTSEEAYAARGACDFAVVASGTATLETALLKVPFVIVYRVNALSFAVAKWLVKIHSIGLANIVAGRHIVPELLQGELDAGRLAASMADFLAHPDKGKTQVRELGPGLKSLGRKGVARRAVRAALALM